MKLLLVIHYPIFGGPHNQALVLGPILERAGVKTTVLLPDEPGNAVTRLRGSGVEVVTMPLQRLRASYDPLRQVRFGARFVPDVLRIREIIRKRRIDVVQISGLVNPHGAVAARLENTAVVWQLLDTRAPMLLRGLLMPLVVRLADVVMTTGRAVARVHPGADQLGNRLRVFFPPVDPDAFAPGKVDRAAARTEFGLGATDVVLGSVGNLNPQKGHEYLLRAAGLIRGTKLKVRLLIVGASYDTHGAYERTLHRLAHELGLEADGDIVFAGGLADVRPALAAMDVFILSSVPRSEGAPTAVEEAMMMGLPVVAADVGSVSEVVDDGVTGLVVPPRDPAAIAEAAGRILRDPVLRERMSVEGRERARKRFSVDRCAEIHQEAYEDAILRRKQRKAGHETCS